MSAISTIAVSSTMPRSLSHTATIYAKEAKYEFLKLWRLPVYSLSTILFPVMFYGLFGLALGPKQHVGPITLATYLLATYGAFGVMGASLFGFGVGLAVERGQGWLEVKRASPMPPLAYFAAKLAMSLLFSLIVVLALLALGVAFGGVRLGPLRALELVSILVAGSIPFCAMGLAIGGFARPNSAPAVVNLLYLPLSFCSGLWIPIEALPKFLNRIAPSLPPYHFGQLALSVIGAGRRGSNLIHVEYLVGFAFVCLGLAWIGFRHGEAKTYG